MNDLSIIIVSYRGRSRLVKCLESIDSFIGKIDKEVIIVDNRSDDGELSKIEKLFPSFTFIRNEVNGGYGNGCNLGAKHASGRYLLFLNPDTVVREPELVKFLATADENPGYTILSCRQVNENAKECRVTGSFPGFWNLTGPIRSLSNIFRADEKPEKGEIIFPDWISGSVVLIKRDNFNNVSGFDEDYWMYFEDVDLCKRIRDSGGTTALCRNVTIEHNHGGSSRINLRTTSITKTEVHVSRHIYIAKHFKGLEKILIQSFLVVNNFITTGLAAIPGLILFFVPKLLVRTVIFGELSKYYILSVFRTTWISPRSVNYGKVNRK